MPPQFLHSLTEKWLPPPFKLTFIRKSTNQVYRVTTPEETYYLRITQHWDQKSLESALDFHRWLYDHKVPICQPLPSKAGNWVESVEWEGTIWFVRMVKSVPGKVLDTELKDVGVYRLWGELVGKIHLVAAEYEPPEWACFLSRKEEWETVMKARKWFKGKEIVEYDLLSEWIKNRLADIPGGYGITHADCNASNFLFDGEKLFTIDIDEPMKNVFLSDVARPFAELRHLPKEESDKYLEVFLEGYLKVRPVPGFKKEDLFWLTRMKSLEAYVWAIELDENAREEEWVKYMYGQFGKET